MKPSLHHPRILGRCLRQALPKQRCALKMPQATTALRTFASARPQPEEDQHRRKLMQVSEATKLKNQANASKPSEEAGVHSTNKEQEFQSPSEVHYPGHTTMPLTSVLQLVKPGDDVPRGIWPVFRLMDENGKFRDPASDAVRQTLPDLRPYETSLPPKQAGDLGELRSALQKLYPFHAEEFGKTGLLQPSKYPYVDTNTRDTLLRAHRHIVRLREMDTIFQNAQRQGRISFYITCHGEEAIHIGSASALDSQDTVFAQYREAGLLMWRGFSLNQFANQLFSNDADLGKGRQMPVHYGSKALSYQTISSPLGTQIPQSVGAAYYNKLQKKPNVAVCFFGDGAASTPDCHSGLNFAATLQAPVIFLTRNNGYAISTPSSEQYAGDGIVSRGPGYGVASIRVDGNCLFSVHAAVREAREYALKNSAPVLLECMTYRLGHHSTSDDSSRYRNKEEVESFQDKADPLSRFELFLNDCGWITESEAFDIRNEEKRAVLKAMGDAEKRPPPPLKELFSDVYYEMPPHLKEQRAQLEEHLKMHKIKY